MKSLIKSLGILTFLFALTSIDPAHAGIVISDGELKSWTIEADPDEEDGNANSDNDPITKYNGTTVYFYKGSAEAVDSDINLEDEPWWGSISLARAFTSELGGFLFSEPSSSSTLYAQNDVEYKFAFEYESADFITSHSVDSYFGTWDSTHYGDPFNDKITDTGYSEGGTEWTFYWASTTPLNSSQVPEPSTAIALGLIGIVGFAGNRRRRRTALNA